MPSPLDCSYSCSDCSSKTDNLVKANQKDDLAEYRDRCSTSSASTGCTKHAVIIVSDIESQSSLSSQGIMGTEVDIDNITNADLENILAKCRGQVDTSNTTESEELAVIIKAPESELMSRQASIHAIQTATDVGIIVNLQRRISGELGMTFILFFAGMKAVQLGVLSSQEEEVVGLIVVGIAVLVAIEVLTMFVWQVRRPKVNVNANVAVKHAVFLALMFVLFAALMVYIGFKYRETPMLTEEANSASTEGELSSPGANVTDAR
jgi:hypothetical protein